MLTSLWLVRIFAEQAAASDSQVLIIVFGALLSALQVWQMFVMADMRARIMRLESGQMLRTLGRVHSRAGE